ncbi:hypothetical protein HanPI659440_Chr04g0149291 [Helianthus annuus]|nr:hypothetical protein HanPI659440_Chr04g0149291 [Helianthus annuus]
MNINQATKCASLSKPKVAGAGLPVTGAIDCNYTGGLSGWGLGMKIRDYPSNNWSNHRKNECNFKKLETNSEISTNHRDFPGILLFILYYLFFFLVTQ